MTNLTSRAQDSVEDVNDLVVDTFDKVVIALAGILAMATLFTFA